MERCEHCRFLPYELG